MRVGGVVVLGLGVLAALALAFAVHVPLFSGIGNETSQPTTVAAVHSTYEHGIGDFRVDLQDVTFPAGSTHVKVTLGIGNLIVTVPRDVTVAVDGRASAGNVQLLGHEDNGTHVHEKVVAERDEARQGARPRCTRRARQPEGAARVSTSPLRLPVALPSVSRSERGRVLAGVCSGIGDGLGVDPTLVRLTFALLAFASGAGIVAYLALWALLPAPGESGVSRRRKIAGAVMLVWAAFLALRGLGLVGNARLAARPRRGGPRARRRSGRAGTARADRPHPGGDPHLRGRRRLPRREHARERDDAARSGRGRGRTAARARPVGAAGSRASATPSGRSGSARRSARSSPRASTTRCCRRWR